MEELNVVARRCFVGLALLLTMLLAEPAQRLHAQAPGVTPVELSGSRPARQVLPTLRFLKANADFLRTRFELFAPDPRVQGSAAQTLDPRFLSYRKMLAEIAAAKDSVARSAEARERSALFASVADLAELEVELDQMERVLAAQEARLGTLHTDFAGRQRTELTVLLTGGALAGRVDSVVVKLEDGTGVVSGLDDTKRRAIKLGGMLEVFRGLVEPREQVIEVRFVGEGWNQTAPAFLRVGPARDRLTFVKLDLSGAAPVRGMSSVSAGTWLSDAPPARASADADRDRP